jgi:hypothetical protein
MHNCAPLPTLRCACGSSRGMAGLSFRARNLSRANEFSRRSPSSPPAFDNIQGLPEKPRPGGFSFGRKR